jgi:hypothetical protein
MQLNRFFSKLLYKAALVFSLGFLFSCKFGVQEQRPAQVDYYPVQQQYYQPVYQYRRPVQPYWQGGAPSSRYYNNPYDIPATGYGQPYYDDDQYYVPPTYYRNVEPQPGQPGFFKNSGSGAF